MSNELQPLPLAVITAHKIREEAHRLLRLADELEASVMVRYGCSGVFKFGEVKQKRRIHEDQKNI